LDTPSYHDAVTRQQGKENNFLLLCEQDTCRIWNRVMQHIHHTARECTVSVKCNFRFRFKSSMEIKTEVAKRNKGKKCEGKVVPVLN